MIRRGALVTVLAGALLLLAVALSLGFTAANAVPGTSAGDTSSAVTIAQLTPVECTQNGLNPTNLVIGSGATVTGTARSDLILGPNITGTVNLNGTGQSDCIVGGGGAGTTNKFSGGPGGDVCIGAPGAVNQFKSCSKTY